MSPLRPELRCVLCTVLVLLGSSAKAADLTIYDDQLRNGFSNTSWGEQENLANPAPTHAGASSVSFVPNNWNGVSFSSSAVLNTSAYRGLVFWIHGGSSGAQQLRLFVANGNTVRAQVDIATLLGAPIAANAWTRVEASFDSGPLAMSGAFDKVYIMDWRDGNPQPGVYLDDFSLLERAAAPGPDPIFASDFEAPPPVAPNGIVIEADVNVGGFRSDRYTWIDSSGRPRSAALVRNTQTDPANKQGGYLRQFTYQLPNLSTRTVTGSFNGHPGFGYVVSHFGEGLGVWGIAGYDTPGQFQVLFAGRHHAIHRYTQTLSMAGHNPSGGVSQYPVGITIDWTMTTGHDHPLWSITYDMSAAPPNAINGDSRSPYGDLTYDGAAPGSGDTVMGVGWGERYKFTSTGGPLTRNSAWTWNQTNSIPYANQWTQSVDAEMGLVQTQTIVQQDAGGYWGSARWNSTSAAGVGCVIDSIPQYQMPCDWNWPYQLNQYSFLGADDTTISKRMAWGTNFGFLGQASYPEMGFTGNRSGHPRQSYSLYVVLDRHSGAPTAGKVSQVETVQTVAFSASLGQVLTQGPAGVGRSDATPYQPSGYNHVYGTWEAQAVGNAATLNLNVGAGSLQRPTLVLRNYTASGLPTLVMLNGTNLVQDVDYFPSVDASGDALWITLNRNLGGANSLAIAP